MLTNAIQYLQRNVHVPPDEGRLPNWTQSQGRWVRASPDFTCQPRKPFHVSIPFESLEKLLKKHESPQRIELNMD